MTISMIGVIHTRFTESAGTPVQPSAARNSEGSVEVFDEFVPGLRDIAGFDRIWLLYWFDRACDMKLSVVPFKDDRAHGLFATRAPCRPNPIGLSAVRLLGVTGGILHIADADMLDGSPLIDIKPYVPAFDVFSVSRCGWLDGASDTAVADDRFEKNNSQPS